MSKTFWQIVQDEGIIIGLSTGAGYMVVKGLDTSTVAELPVAMIEIVAAIIGRWGAEFMMSDSVGASDKAGVRGAATVAKCELGKILQAGLSSAGQSVFTGKRRGMFKTFADSMLTAVIGGFIQVEYVYLNQK